MSMKFNELGLSKAVLSSIESLGFDQPSKIQQQIIPVILNGADVIGQAQTGTGKTLAFAASILSNLKKKKGVKAIILAPTRELALQVAEEFDSLNGDRAISILAVFGGSSIDKQIQAFRKGVDIVVGTPGRVIDLIKRRVLNLDSLDYFVLDEADEMLNMGFIEDIKEILGHTNSEKQIMLFSATMPKPIQQLAFTYMKKNHQVIAIEEKSKTSVQVKQSYYSIDYRHRAEALCRVLDGKDPHLAIIFCQTKKDVDDLFTELSKRHYSVEAMHGDITQALRIQTLDRFKQGAFQYLIATDVAARGIHVDHIDMVINYNTPQDVESYIHRIGRTGRANEVGEAISLVSPKEERFLKDVERIAHCQIEKKELPVREEILFTKSEKIMNRLNEIIESNAQDPYLEYVRDKNKEDLLKFSAALLKLAFEREVGSNFDQAVKSPQVKRTTSSSSTRVFLTIGKMDNLKKGTLLDFLKDVTKENKDHFQNIEILTKFTFMDIDNVVLDNCLKKIHNQKLNNRIIHIEIAKKR